MISTHKVFWYTLRCFTVKLGIIAVAIVALFAFAFGGATLADHYPHFFHILGRILESAYFGLIVFLIGYAGHMIWKSCADAVAREKL